MSCINRLQCTPRTKFLKTNLLITTLSLPMICHCFWTPFGEVFGVQMAPESLPKTMCKTCLNFEAILNAFWNHFRLCFWRRMAGPFNNCRFLRCSFLRLALGSVRVGPRGRFWDDFGSSLMPFCALFLEFQACCLDFSFGDFHCDGGI